MATEVVVVEPRFMGCCPWGEFLKWLLVVLSVLMFIIAIAAIVPASKIRGVIPIIEIIASSIGMILAIIIIAAIFIPSLKLMVTNYYLSIGLLILKVVTFILILIYFTLMSSENDKGYSTSMFIASLFSLLIHMALPFAIGACVQVAMDPNRNVHGVFDVVLCQPCRKSDPQAATTATSASANSRKLSEPNK